MSKNKGMAKIKKMAPAKNADAGKALGRKRDPKLDDSILEAALDILAEKGFDSMTMDMVAARAKAGKATLYRRWPSKPELVRDALIFMSRSSVESGSLPDTGSLKDDLLAVIKPYSSEHGQRKIRVLSRLGSFFSDHEKFADEAIRGIFAPWNAINLALMQRAKERGKISKKADTELMCEIIAAVTAFKTNFQKKSFTRACYETLLDKVLLPAMKAD